MTVKSLGSVLSTNTYAFQNLPQNLIPLKLPPKISSERRPGLNFWSPQKDGEK
ncbi:hypothetical protein MA16_Dca013881 [Dendrobium catenatum]|uniref:Uncharacterized protein n=1 Tax=Dendrobium catenatum TaxID=906689 RepID=A0A2I0WCN6_9ASPA|nr:hypothetical protein MA16_Dca013881 [Dendrobium catenatum]